MVEGNSREVLIQWFPPPTLRARGRIPSRPSILGWVDALWVQEMYLRCEKDRREPLQLRKTLR